MKILVADDEKDVVEILKKNLTQKGHTVDTALDGDKALHFIELNRYDIVFVDHNMPEVTGLELIKYIKQNNLGAKTVMITGYPHLTNLAVKDLGADEYLVKPLKLEDIYNIIEKYKGGDKKNG